MVPLPAECLVACISCSPGCSLAPGREYDIDTELARDHPAPVCCSLVAEEPENQRSLDFRAVFLSPFCGDSGLSWLS